jgi:TolA-binding protein
LSKLILLSFLSVAILAAQERSMFGAGDLNSPEPYGLTSAEKVIVKNKKALNANEKRIKKVDSELQSLSERIDGIESIFVGDGQKLNSVHKKFNLHIDDFKNTKENNLKEHTLINQKIKETNDRISEIELNIKSNTENIKLLKKSLDKVVRLVNDINGKYVTKKEFNYLLKLLDKKPVATTTSEKKKSSSSDFKSMPKKKILSEAKRYFKKDYFTKALPMFEYLVENNYRPAESNFYIGEIKFYRKKYSDALGFFKTSMMLYDKAKYLPKLLLHSAISFEKIGDNDNAQNFYNTLVEVYPKSKEAKEASKKIK